jgi:hypothetical protein
MTTKSAIRVFLWVGVALFLGTWANAQTSVTLTAPSPGPSYDGIYVSPYYATVGGVANTPIICDDFGDDTTIGDKWTATVTTFSGLTAPAGTSWDLAGRGSLAGYNAVAYLTTLVLAQASGSTGQIIDTFADWAVFDPTGVATYLKNNPVTTGSLTTAQLCTDIFGSAGCTGTWVQADGGLLATAYGAPVPSGGYGLEIISPDTPGTSNVCPAETGCPAQEFIAVVPEGGAAMAYLLLAGLCCFGAIRMRSRRQMGSVSVA